MVIITYCRITANTAIHCYDFCCQDLISIMIIGQVSGCWYPGPRSRGIPQKLQKWLLGEMGLPQRAQVEASACAQERARCVFEKCGGGVPGFDFDLWFYSLPGYPKP